MIRRRLTFLLLLAACMVVSACSSETVFSGECKRDSDCQQYERCDTMDFRCVCAVDEACAQGEYCNASGSCQVKSGCFTNDDCSAGSICDTLTGECIGATACTRDEHCEIGKICENRVCRLGCRDTADCSLAEREVCISGVCVRGKCANTGYCAFGLVCNPANSECEQPTALHCQPGCDPICAPDRCPNTGDSPCGDPTAICAGLDVLSSHCWFPCDPLADACPSGYLCKPTTFSWAVCVDDGECANVQNTCGQFSHRCALNQQVCESNADCHDFGPPTCLSGYCVVGYHCEPTTGCQ